MRDFGKGPGVCKTGKMLECWEYLAGHCDPDYVREITRENALSVIRDEEV